MEFKRFRQNVIPDLRDNFRSEKVPPSVAEKYEVSDRISPLAERFMMPGMQDEFFADTAEFARGEYRARVAVGKVEDGTRHPHDYVLQKRDNELDLYFVDPEHHMGRSRNKSRIPLPRKGDVRPKISTLIGVRMIQDQIVPDISILRYRAAAISDPKLLKMDPQLEIAKQILETGEIPDLLEGSENEITFRLNITKGEQFVQSRYASEQELTRFLEGAESASALEGKLSAYKQIMQHFRKHIRAGLFKPLPGIPSEPPTAAV